jgi:non-reducing end alpha-L-arabinofuranosidase
MRYFVVVNSFRVILSIIIIIGISQHKVSAAPCPCDIYAADGTPCVAAHSTVRALYESYNGPLYQVTRKSDKKTIDIGVRSPGGLANSAAQDSFLGTSFGSITIIYDQSANHNDLTPAPNGYWPPACTAASAIKAPIKLNGFTVYGVYTLPGNFPGSAEAPGIGYRNNKTKGIVTGNNAEGMYMVCGGKHYNQWCCFDYGNAQTNSTDNGNATMESIYFGNSTQWGHGSGNGPWVMNDCENGMQAGVDPNGTKGVWAGNTSIIADYVTGIVKSDTSNLWAIRAGDATKDTLKTMYRGRQYPGFFPKKLEGAIILGTGGDNSHTGEGTFFEGAMTKGMPSDTTENAIQKNIIAAGYGRTFVSVARNGAAAWRRRHDSRYATIHQGPMRSSTTPCQMFGAYV